MAKDIAIKLYRGQLYNEIWDISVVGVAKKYNIPYTDLLRICQLNDIPIPPSGYWTKLRFGKSVNRPSLPDSLLNELELTNRTIKRRSRNEVVSNANGEKTVPKAKQLETKDLDAENATETETSQEEAISEKSQSLQPTKIIHRAVEGQYNTYGRDQLYEEVWAKPVIEVAAQYGVSDVMIHKICKSLDVPVPPRGYWAKIRSGGKFNKPPLPPTKGATQLTGAKNFEAIPVNASSQVLSFLSDDEREQILIAASQIDIPDENAQLHKKIVAYRTVVKEWNKKDGRDEYAQRSLKNYSDRPPFLAGIISKYTLPRVYRTLDALYRQVESLGGIVNDDLSLTIRNELIHLDVIESQDEVEHVMTRQEAQQMIIYEDAKRRNSWASAPNIRRYDYVFNGKIRINIRQRKYFKDTDKNKVESRLGEILVEMWEESEVIRIEREAREEAERKRKEDEIQREEKLNRYNQEIERTIALENEALDYEKACRIRSYVKAVETAYGQDGLDGETAAWIDWARKKADWFDPIVARDDELFGVREHEESEEQKTLKKSWRYW